MWLSKLIVLASIEKNIGSNPQLFKNEGKYPHNSMDLSPCHSKPSLILQSSSLDCPRLESHSVSSHLIILTGNLLGPKKVASASMSIITHCISKDKKLS